ncbi:50S ribosomal protein L28 [Candidatus Aerophobetes bacterium]|nr:50S ribosomal protein L28 [Candidatus Aerophobetes bacterium]
MSRVCQICGKRASTGHTVSKSGRKVKRRWLPNLQHIKIKKEGSIKRAYICTRCLRSGKVEKVI